MDSYWWDVVCHSFHPYLTTAAQVVSQRHVNKATKGPLRYWNRTENGLRSDINSCCNPYVSSGEDAPCQWEPTLPHAFYFGHVLQLAVVGLECQEQTFLVGSCGDVHNDCSCYK